MLRRFSEISTTVADSIHDATGVNAWQAAMQKIDDHLSSLLRPGGGWKDSFNWRVIYRDFGNNPIRRQLLLFEQAFIIPRRSSLNYARAVVSQSSLLAQGSERRLQDYVSFTRVDFHPVDKLSCDWCAICNGLLAWTGDLLDDALRQSNPLIAHWRFDDKHLYRHAFTVLRWLPLSAIKRHHDPAVVAAQLEDIRLRAQQVLAGAELDTFMSEARHFVIVRHNATCLERRYCPFRHLRELAYSEDYWIYDWRVPEQMVTAARVLAEHGAVDCQDCAAALANSPLFRVDDTPSIMEDFFELLCRSSSGC